MSLAAGGHLTHGAAPNPSGKWFNAVQYGVDETTAQVDFEALQKLAEKHRPKLILAGGSAYPRTLDFAAFRKIADSVGALFMVDMAHISGWSLLVRIQVRLNMRMWLHQPLTKRYAHRVVG